MWILRPYTPPKALSVDLPIDLVNTLGFGVNMLVSFLENLSEAVIEDRDSVPTPPLELCRICERYVPTWWFEGHSDLCLVEHRSQSDVDSTNENLLDQRKTIKALLMLIDNKPKLFFENAPSAQSPYSSPSPDSNFSSKSLSNSPTPKIEYRGFLLAIPEQDSQIKTPSSPRSPRIDTQIGPSNRPLVKSLNLTKKSPIKVMEMLIELCDLALDINNPEFSSEHKTCDLHSPASKRKISQATNWVMPQVDDKALTLLCEDTSKYAKQKVEAISRLGDTMTYFQRVTNECERMVLNAIEDTAAKASQQNANNACEDNANEMKNNSDEERTDIDERSSIFENSYLKSDSLPVTPTSKQRGLGLDASDPYVAVASLTPKSLLADSNPGAYISDDVPVGMTPSKLKHSISMNEAFTLPLPELDLNVSSPSTKMRSKRSISNVSPSYQNSNSQWTSIQRNKVTQSSEIPSPSPQVSSPLNSASEGKWENTYRRQYSSGSDFSRAPVSPLLISTGPSKPSPPSIKDYEIINAISKGAFGSVYLARKRNTGEYFAIKVLKKADMIAKNQVMNVRAERAIMMSQSESHFVAKLYFTFQSKSYLYLVMEYLNGGDCASLLKVLGGVPEEWAKKYIAEVIAGVEDLHAKGIVHRDLKPDNLLINHNGHLKLTDFGLSRMGLVDRQTRRTSVAFESMDGESRSGSGSRSESEIFSSKSNTAEYSKGTQSDASASNNPDLIRPLSDSTISLVPDYFQMSSKSPLIKPKLSRSMSNGSTAGEALCNNAHILESAMWMGLDELSNSSASSDAGSATRGESNISNETATPRIVSTSVGYMALFNPVYRPQLFVGTPDYLAPEIIRGTGQDEKSDWWSVGCILFEFLYGYPPFHAETPELVFENILNRNIQWPETTRENDDKIVDSSLFQHAHDLIDKLLNPDPALRLGNEGADDIKKHVFLSGVNWDTLWSEEASFIPVSEDPESTDYFDPRGAEALAFPTDDHILMDEEENQNISEEDLNSGNSNNSIESPFALNRKGPRKVPLHIPPHVRNAGNRRLSDSNVPDDFGSFAFKNLPMLDKANKNTLSRIVTENLERRNSITAETSKRPRGLSISTTSSFQRPESPSFSSRHISPVRQMTLPSNSSNSAQSPLLATSVFVGSPVSTGSPSASSSSTSTQHKLAASRSKSIPKVALFAGDSKLSNEDVLLHSPFPSPITRSPLMNNLSPSKSTTSPSAKLQIPISPRALGIRRQSSMERNEQNEQTTKSVNQKYKSVFDTSPANSDTEEFQDSSLSKLQRRRELSFNDSNSGQTTPSYRPLIVLICESNPALRYSMAQIVKRLNCRYVTVSDASDSIRYATGDIKFDLIFTEFRFPKATGADVARIIHTTSNPNSETPIVCVTSYAPEAEIGSRSNFSCVISKPPTREKLCTALEKYCSWKPKEKHKQSF